MSSVDSAYIMVKEAQSLRNTRLERGATVRLRLGHVYNGGDKSRVQESVSFLQDLMFCGLPTLSLQEFVFTLPDE